MSLLSLPRCSRYAAHKGCIALFSLIALVLGCTSKPENNVVLYSSADREYATPILDAFERNQSGVEIARQFDVEASKTLGLVTRIEQEQTRPRCDVFWNNEIIHTIRLQQKGLLASRTWKIPSNWPKNYRAKDGTWVGYAGRARVLLVNKTRLPDESMWPKSIIELAEVRWHHRCGMAYPMYGTTATHIATLKTHATKFECKSETRNEFSTDGSTLDWEKWIASVAKNAVVVAGNKQVALAVGRGELDWGVTDTDDAVIEKENGQPVELIFPDQEEGGFGALLIPNTVCVIKNSPHPTAASLLADYLVSEKTEARLSMGNGAQFPIWPDSSQKSRLLQSQSVHWADVDFEAVANGFGDTLQKIKVVFDSTSK